MDKRCVARIPSIFDSDDEEEDRPTSPSNSVSQEDNIGSRSRDAVEEEPCGVEEEDKNEKGKEDDKQKVKMKNEEQNTVDVNEEYYCENQDDSEAEDDGDVVENKVNTVEDDDGEELNKVDMSGDDGWEEHDKTDMSGDDGREEHNKTDVSGDDDDGEEHNKTDISGDDGWEEKNKADISGEEQNKADISEGDGGEEQNKADISVDDDREGQDKEVIGEDENSKDFEEVVEQESAVSYNEDEEEMTEKEEREIFRGVGSSSSGVNEEVEGGSLDEDVEMDDKVGSKNISISDEDSEDFDEMEENENSIDDYLSDDDEDGSVGEIENMENKDDEKHHQGELDDEIEDLEKHDQGEVDDEMEDLEEEEKKLNEVEEMEEEEGVEEMEEDEEEGIGTGVAITEDNIEGTGDDESLTDEEEETPVVDKSLTDEEEETPAVDKSLTDEEEETPAFDKSLTDEEEETPAVDKSLTDEEEETPAVDKSLTDEEEETPAVDKSLTDEEEEIPAVDIETNNSLEMDTNDKGNKETEEVDNDGVLDEEAGNKDELVKEDGSDGEVVQEIKSRGELKKKVGSIEKVVEGAGSSGEVPEEIKSSDEVVTEAAGSNGELAEEAESNDEAAEEAASNDEELDIDDNEGEPDEKIDINSDVVEDDVDNGDLVEEVGSNGDVVEELGSDEDSASSKVSCKVVNEADAVNDDSDKEGDHDKKDDSSVYEEGSDGYVIDLNDSEDESCTGSTKLEDREDVVDSSTSSSAASEGRVKTKDITEESPGSLKLKTPLTDQKESPEESPRSPETAEGTTTFAKKLTFNIQKDKETNEGIREKAPLVRVPVRVEDIYTDSEDETKKTPVKDVEVEDEIGVDLASDTTSVDQDDQKETVSVSSRTESAEPEPHSPDAAAQTSTPKGDRPRIWVSSSIFDKKETPKLAEKISDVVSPSSRVVRSHNKNKGVDKQKCLYAFEKGWRREMVHRSTVDAAVSGKIRADIYYYTPEGKKLRSKVEIEDYLLRKGIADLTIENFSFAKEPVGGTKEQEQIRHAVKGAFGPPAQRNLLLGDEAAKSPFSQAKKRGRPNKVPKEAPPMKKVKTASTVDVPMIEEKDIGGTTFRRIVKPALGNTYSNRVKVSTGSSRPINTLGSTSSSRPINTLGNTGSTRPITTMGVKPATSMVSSPSTPKSSQSSKASTTTTTAARSMYVNKNHVVFTTKFCRSIGLPARILTPMLSERNRQQLFHCTGQCQLGAGTVPNLQCIKCLCLFHGKCTYMPSATVALVQSGGARFLCPNCYKENKENTEDLKYTPPTPHELLVQDPSSSSDSSDIEGDVEIIGQSNIYTDYVKVDFNKTISVPTPPASPIHSTSETVEEHGDKDESSQTGVTSASSSLTTVSTSASSSSQYHLGNASVPPTNIPNSPNSVLGVGPGGQIIKIPSQTGATPRLIFVRPQQSGPNLQQMAQVGPPRAVYFPSLGGPLMLSGPGTSYINQPPHYVNGGNLSTPSQLPVYATPGIQYSQPVSSTTFAPQPLPSKQKTPPRSHPKANISQKKNFLQELSLSYQLLLHVFKYLTAKDLLVTSRVCLMWRDLSYSTTLWSTLRLRNICVSNWSLLAMFLERRNTRSIDLRKMVFKLRPCSSEQEEISKDKSPSHSKEGSPSHSKDESPSHSPSSVKNTLTLPKKRHADGSYTKEYDDCDNVKLHDNQPIDLSSCSSKGGDPVKNGSVSPKKSKLCVRDEITLFSEKEKSKMPFGDPKELKTDTSESSPQNVEHSNKESTCSSAEATGNQLELSPQKCNKESSPTRTSLNSSDDSKTRDGNEIEGPDKDHSEKQCSLDSNKDKQEIVTVSSDSEEEPMEVTEDVSTKCTNKVNRNERSMDEKAEDEGNVIGDTITFRKSSATDITNKHSKYKKDAIFAVPAVSEDESNGTKKREIDTWHHICEVLGTVRCLRSVVLPPCTPEILHLLLSNCRNITSVTAADIITSSDNRFDPAYFMEAPRLKEIRIASAQGLNFTTNINFMKLPDLKVLVIKGFTGNCWPHLSTNLTSLHLGPCHTFTHETWRNIANMKNLRALWLEDGGSANDNHMLEAVNQLSQLRRLCLFNFTVGTRLGFVLKKLTKLERLFVLQNSSGGESMGVKNHNMLAVTEHLRYVDELVWAVSSQDVKVINGVEHMHISSPKVKSYPSLSAKENSSDQWPLKLIEIVIKRHLPETKVRIMKLDPAAAARMALYTL